MQATAKVFSAGNSQAVRLPKAFRVDAREMWISRNAVTGEITLRPKDAEDLRRKKIEALFKAIADNPFTEDFLAQRDAGVSRNPLEEWAEPLPAKAASSRSRSGKQGRKP